MNNCALKGRRLRDFFFHVLHSNAEEGTQIPKYAFFKYIYVPEQLSKCTKQWERQLASLGGYVVLWHRLSKAPFQTVYSRCLGREENPSQYKTALHFRTSYFKLQLQLQFLLTSVGCYFVSVLSFLFEADAAGYKGICKMTHG